ncbi:hypothetical protein BKA93DRAFT_156634 [Sparassis latifolia]|uniref:Uncharacterized protein n=1 Tax=Sparassis crispa TaxID=139825 RepID=A0A401H2Z9_9APHY|nr:hypothetical protein SCP_1401770 [Sparassis crispa]GBE88772.1 hypothetical protein SCP_1401770 [Sparassis crispa]
MDRRQGSSLTSDGQGKGYGKHLSSQDESKCLQKALSSMGARLAKAEKQRQEKGKEHHRFLYTSFILLDRIRDLVATSCGFEDSSWMHMLYKMEKEPDRDWAKYAQESLAEISDDEIPLEIPLEELRYILTDLHDPPDIDRIPTLVRWRNDFCKEHEN